MSTENLKVRDLVLIQDPNSSPLVWPLGRITTTHPGAENVVRDVTIRTASGTLSRLAIKVFHFN